jgi:hypothetical protein
MSSDHGPVDAVVCRWGVMLMGDPDAALRAIHGALRAGARLARATWDTPDRNLWTAVPGMQLVARGALPMPDPRAPGPFAMPDPVALASLGDDARIEVQEAARSALSKFAPQDGALEIPASVVVASARA